MNLYIGVNQDGSEIISKMPLKRYISYEANREDVLCYNDTLQPPHWMLDYTGIEVGKTGIAPIDIYLTLPAGSIKRMFGVKLTWNDNFKIINL